MKEYEFTLIVEHEGFPSTAACLYFSILVVESLCQDPTNVQVVDTIADFAYQLGDHWVKHTFSAPIVTPSSCFMSYEA